MARPKGSKNKSKEEKDSKPVYEKKTNAQGEPYKYNYTTKPGRPSSYKPEYCDLVIELMSKGASIAAVAAELKVARAQIFKWGEEYPEFRSACDAGKELAQQWWEKLAGGVASGAASTHAVHKKANHGMIMFLMSRRFPDYYAKNQSDIRQQTEVKQTQQVLVFESQLAGGVIRQTNSVAEISQELQGMISEVTDEVCQKQEFE